MLHLCAADGCATHGLANTGEADLCHPIDDTKCHALAALARALVEAIIVPSCTGFPEGNLIIFPDRLDPASAIRVVRVIDPNLAVDWSAYE